MSKRQYWVEGWTGLFTELSASSQTKAKVASGIFAHRKLAFLLSEHRLDEAVWRWMHWSALRRRLRYTGPWGEDRYHGMLGNGIFSGYRIHFMLYIGRLIDVMWVRQFLAPALIGERKMPRALILTRRSTFIWEEQFGIYRKHQDQTPASRRIAERILFFLVDEELLRIEGMLGSLIGLPSQNNRFLAALEMHLKFEDPRPEFIL